MGDYFMDLDHGKTGHAIEPDLDTGEAPRGGGPFQVPFEVFIPEKVDGMQQKLFIAGPQLPSELRELEQKCAVAAQPR